MFDWKEAPGLPSFFLKKFPICIICGVTLDVLLCILWNVNWILGDDKQFITTTAIGKYLVSGWQHSGRMWPLGLWDYNILNFIPWGYTPLGHYIYNTVTFLIMVYVLFKLFESITEKRYYYLLCFSFLVLFVSNGFILVNIDVIYAERMLALLLSIFMYCSLKGQQTQKSKYYAIALLAACYATYCKEPIFGLLAVIALTNLIFGSLTKKDKIFYYLLLLNSFVYITAYYFLVWKTTTSFYHIYFFYEGRKTISTIQLIKDIFYDNTILCATVLLALIRGYFVIFKKDRKHLFFDSLIFASVAYVLAYIFLRIRNTYYFVPSVVLAVPVFLYWSTEWNTTHKKIVILSVIAMSFLMIRDFGNLKNCIKGNQFQRKNHMMEIEALAKKLTEFTKIVSVYDTDLAKTCWHYKLHIAARINSLNCYMNYYLQNHLKSHPIAIQKSNNWPQITKSEVLIYPIENYEGKLHHKVYPWLEKNNFTTIAYINNTNVFATKKINPLKMPFFYSFKSGIIDTDLFFNCFGKINPTGAVAATDSPVIKFKVDSKGKDLIVKFRISLQQDTFVGEDVVVHILANDKALSTFVIDRKSPQTVGVLIPRDLIEDDKMVAIRFQSINELKTEKELNRSDSNMKRGLVFKDISIDQDPDSLAALNELYTRQ